MLRGEGLHRFAADDGIPVLAVADLVHHRRSTGHDLPLGI
jgi:hypothetical protein